MMTVGDVKIGNFLESGYQWIVSGDSPNRMMNIVVRDKVVERRIAGQASTTNESIFSGRDKSETPGLSARAEPKCDGAIVLFIAAGTLVFANNVTIVFLN